MPCLTRTLPDGSDAVYAWFAAMHTRVDILLRSAVHGPDYLTSTIGLIRRQIARIEATGNRFDPSSELAALNRLPAGRIVTLSPLLHHILALCLDYHKQTEGLFDITVNTPGHTPSTITHIHLGPGRTFSRDLDTIIIDLSGFIKGYTLDRIKPLLLRRGITDALINMGNSSIMALGDVPGPVTDACLTTSDNDTPDRLHIIDPRTGQPLHGQRTSQVITPGGAQGEVAATVRFIREQ